MGNRIKGKQGKKEGKFVKEPPKPKIEDFSKCTPLFCMEYMTDDEYSLDCCAGGEREIFFDALKKRCELTWNDINQQGRHELGTEIIPPRKIKKSMPHDFPDRNNGLNILSLHSKGASKNRIIGARKERVFYIFWYDPKGNLYSHDGKNR